MLFWHSQIFHKALTNHLILWLHRAAQRNQLRLLLPHYFLWPSKICSLLLNVFGGGISYWEFIKVDLEFSCKKWDNCFPREMKSFLQQLALLEVSIWKGDQIMSDSLTKTPCHVSTYLGVKKHGVMFNLNFSNFGKINATLLLKKYVMFRFK